MHQGITLKLYAVMDPPQKKSITNHDFLIHPRSANNLKKLSRCRTSLQVEETSHSMKNSHFDHGVKAPTKSDNFDRFQQLKLE